MWIQILFWYKKSQIIIHVPVGSAKVTADDGKNKQDFLLNDPTKVLYLDKMVWKEMHDFYSDCVMVVMSSENYDSEEYINDINEWKKLVAS